MAPEPDPPEDSEATPAPAPSGSKPVSAEARGSAGAGTDVPAMGPSDKSPPSLTAMLLLEAGEMENRLRQHVISLLEPSLRRQAIFDTKLKEVKAAMDQQNVVIDGFSKKWDGAETLRAMVDGFRAEMAEWDSERRSKEQVLGDRLSHQETELSALRQSMERKAADSNSNSRAIKGLSEILTQLQEELVELRRYCSDRLDVNRDKMSKLRDEFETRHFALEGVQHQLLDQQTSTDMLIDGIKAHLQRMAADLAENVTKVEDLHLSKATVVCVEEQQQEFHAFSRQLNGQVAGLRQQLNGLVSDVKAHFQSAVQVVGVSTARQMDDMRAKYGHDEDLLCGKLKEMTDLVDRGQTSEKELRDEMLKVSRLAENKLAEFQKKLDELALKRDMDGGSLSLEVSKLQKRIKELESPSLGRGVGHGSRNDVLAMMVESELLGAMLEMQDDQDRKSISLVGYKGVESKQSPYPSKDEGSKPWALPELDGGTRRSLVTSSPTRPSGDATRTPRRKAAGAVEGPPVMTIDKRCLSCSGSTATVLAGFKLACLQYAPSPVVYRETPHSRTELIRLRMDLLKQAKEELRLAVD